MIILTKNFTYVKAIFWFWTCHLREGEGRNLQEELRLSIYDENFKEEHEKDLGIFHSPNKKNMKLKKLWRTYY